MCSRAIKTKHYSCSAYLCSVSWAMTLTYTLNRLSSFQNLRLKGGRFDHRPERPKVLLYATVGSDSDEGLLPAGFIFSSSTARRPRERALLRLLKLVNCRAEKAVCISRGDRVLVVLLRFTAGSTSSEVATTRRTRRATRPPSTASSRGPTAGRAVPT